MSPVVPVTLKTYNTLRQVVSVVGTIFIRLPTFTSFMTVVVSHCFSHPAVATDGTTKRRIPKISMVVYRIPLPSWI
jgi:hypothetical protein